MTIYDVATLLVFLAVFVMLYYTSVRDTVQYAIRCSAYLLIAIYLIKQLKLF